MNTIILINSSLIFCDLFSGNDEFVVLFVWKVFFYYQIRVVFMKDSWLFLYSNIIVGSSKQGIRGMFKSETYSRIPLERFCLIILIWCSAQRWNVSGREAKVIGIIKKEGIWQSEGIWPKNANFTPKFSENVVFHQKMLV